MECFNKPIEVRAVEALGLGFDLASDFRLKYAKRCPDGGRLVEVDESRRRDIVLPGGGATVSGVSEDIRCDKGDRIRFKSDVLEFNKMSELLNQKSSIQGKVPSGYFNALFDLSGSWLNDAADAKYLAFDGYFISLYYLHLTASPLVLQESVKNSVPTCWNPLLLARFIQTYGTHIIVGMAVGGQDLICVKQKPSSTISSAELRGYLDDLGDNLFSDGGSPSLIDRKTRDGKQKVPDVFTRMLQPHTKQFTNITETSSKDIHCTAYNVEDHLQPPKASSSTPDPLWKRLDAIVLQWIYGTITHDLMQTIMSKKPTAHSAWTALEQIFVDSKPTRALYLQQKFTNTKIDAFPNASAYCQELKTLADQLANVDAPVTDQGLVLQLIAGLNQEYDNIAAMLQQTHPLPNFHVARSRLILEETRRAHSITPTTTALNITTSSNTSKLPNTNPSHIPNHQTTQHPPPSPHPNQQPYTYQSPGRGRGGWDYTRGRGRGGRGRGRGRSRGRGYHYSSNWNHQNPWGQQQPSWSYPQQGWPTPPCPYPTTPFNSPAPSRPPHPAPGILGPAPSQAYASSESSYTPTNIEQAMHTMSLNPEQSWIMDTGATNHMSNTTGLPDSDSYPPM